MPAIKKVPCEVTGVRAHGERIYTVTLEPRERLPRFSAGQFLHLALDPYDPSAFWPESRVFSIASPPSRTEPLEILYSVKGRFTTRMEQELKPGREVWVKLPYGEFVFDDIARPRALLAGGTGISAFSSLLRAVAGQSAPVPLTLVYGVRNPGLIFYHETLQTLVERRLCRRLCLFVENDPPPPASGWEIFSGRIDLDALGAAWADEPAADCYLAGPPAMLTLLSAGLRARQIPGNRIHVDQWE